MEIPTSVDMGSEEYVVNLLLPLFKPHMPFRFSKTITTIHCARMELPWRPKITYKYHYHLTYMPFAAQNGIALAAKTHQENIETAKK